MTYTTFQYNLKTGESKPVYQGDNLEAAIAAYNKISQKRVAYIRNHQTGENVRHNF